MQQLQPGGAALAALHCTPNPAQYLRHHSMSYALTVYFSALCYIMCTDQITSKDNCDPDALQDQRVH